MKTNIIYNCDCLSGLRELTDNSVDCGVTSPPYYGLRDYGVDGQIGLEDTPEAFITRLVEVFREVRRVLKPSGTCWVNMGDSYAGNAKPGGGDPTIGNRNLGGKEYLKKKVPAGLKCKDLIGIPWMLAFALRADGWYLRQDIIWSKPNPMPESVTDRCTKAHEYIFLLAKSAKYYFGDIKEPAKGWNGSKFEDGKNLIIHPNVSKNRQKKPSGLDTKKGAHRAFHREGRSTEAEYTQGVSEVRNKRSVWTIATQPLKEAHFAAYPDALIVDCIKAGCPENGVVLDPFMGSGTTAIVARKLNRNYIGYELNHNYIQIAERRLHQKLGMFQ